MNSMSLRYAERGVRLLQAALQRQPPPGVTTEFVGSFFQQFGPSLQGELAKLLDAAWARRQQLAARSQGAAAGAVGKPNRNANVCA